MKFVTTDGHGKVVFTLSVPLAFSIVIVSCIGILTPGFYAKETMNWQAQSIGQDYINLILITPLLIISAIFAYRKNVVANLLWAGTVLYILYTFIIYCFDLHFNKLFVVYCFTLGLSFSSIFYFILSHITEPLLTSVSNTSVIRVTGISFLIIAAIFYFLWLSEIVPAITSDTTPKSLSKAGLFTNPVHIIDLSVFLPGLFITGILLLKRHTLGFLFAPVMLVFFILMDITIGWLVIVMKQKGLETNISITVIMSVLALYSLVLLIWYVKNMAKSIASFRLKIDLDVE